MREVKAPDGYLILKEPLKITVVKDYKIQTFVVENQKIQTVIEKTDTETGEPVAGAVLRLIDETGNEVAWWVTTNQKPEIGGGYFKDRPGNRGGACRSNAAADTKF